VLPVLSQIKKKKLSFDIIPQRWLIISLFQITTPIYPVILLVVR
jgi:hypothetical protein